MSAKSRIKSTSKVARRPRAPKKSRTAGTRIVWPKGVEERFGFSAPTRWRWERSGKLPRRDVYANGVAIGWRPETLAAAERGKPTAISSRKS